MERKRKQRAERSRALVVTGLRPIERLMSWEIDLVRDRIEAIVRDAGPGPVGQVSDVH